MTVELARGLKTIPKSMLLFCRTQENPESFMQECIPLQGLVRRVDFAWLGGLGIHNTTFSAGSASYIFQDSVRKATNLLSVINKAGRTLTYYLTNELRLGFILWTKYSQWTCCTQKGIWWKNRSLMSPGSETDMKLFVYPRKVSIIATVIIWWILWAKGCGCGDVCQLWSLFL